MKLYLTILFLFSLLSLKGQLHQTVRGNVIDQQSRSGISNVMVSVPGTDLVSITDDSGLFTLNEIPIGRTRLVFMHDDYELKELNNVVVEAGKETILEIELLENMYSGEIEEIIIVSKGKSKLFDMATTSAAAFDAESTRRFAGSRNDVSRMASNFAGINSANDASNDIIIRGNSPLGLLWRLEGVDIPNPNHFGSLGATGGPVGIINNNVLGQSAFYTGAFPAQFGNATSGVFDLYLRKGNPNRHEYTAQVGFNGLEVGAEGPLNQESKASYLINYRYSIPGLLNSLGVDVGTGEAIPKYQDISFHVEIPTEKAGKFALFGMGGISEINFKANLKDTANFYSDPYNDLFNKTKMGVAGIKHTYFFNSNTSSVITLAASGSNVITKQDSLDLFQIPHKYYRENGSEWRYTASLLINKKFSAKNRFTAGIMTDQLHYSYKDSILDNNHGFIPFLQEKNHTELLRGYLQWQHRFNDRITLNSGFYSQFLTLNNDIAIDGRVGLRYKISNQNTLTLAYGGHSQMQSLMTYFHETRTDEGNFVQTNRKLGFTKSHHIVAGWEQVIKNSWKFKTELYGQYLNRVPVETIASDWSALNIGAGYGAGLEDSLVNKGTGYNYGLELTVERPFANGYYFLGTGSLYNSKFKGSNKKEHNTLFNNNYVINLLTGKEWKIGKIHTIAADFKGTLAGGKRYTPIDEQASIIANKPVFIDERAFELQFKPYFRLDLKLTYRMNHKRFMQEFFIDFQNITDHENILAEWYDSRAGKIRTQNQLGFWPNFNYRIQFAF